VVRRCSTRLAKYCFLQTVFSALLVYTAIRGRSLARCDRRPYELPPNLHPGEIVA
jgi:hypothetical protein